jgi:hypothetical protein
MHLISSLVGVPKILDEEREEKHSVYKVPPVISWHDLIADANLYYFHQLVNTTFTRKQRLQFGGGRGAVDVNKIDSR